MRFVIQRVTEAAVRVDGELLGQIEKGYLVLIGVAESDTEEIADKMVKKMTVCGFLKMSRERRILR